MILIAGLGNPGHQYETTRHNFGFLTLDHFAQKHQIDLFQMKFNSIYAKATLTNCDVLLFKPQTYMNLSGQAVQSFSQFYKIDPERIIVLHDEIDLDFGDIRVKHQGGHAGHNGIKSIIESLGSDGFHRIRLGVGRPKDPHQDVSDYVLDPFDTEQLSALPHLFDQASSMLEKTIAELS